jgi:hypothetical protein
MSYLFFVIYRQVFYETLLSFNKSIILFLKSEFQGKRFKAEKERQI